MCVHLRGIGFDGRVECVVRIAGAEALRKKVHGSPLTDFGAVACTNVSHREPASVQCGPARLDVELDPTALSCVTVRRDPKSGALTLERACNGYD